MQKDRKPAIAFLKSVATEDSEHQDFSGASWGAVTALSHMNDEGLTALEELREAGAITDPRAHGYVAWYLGDGGKR